MAEHDITKLPKWAQHKITTLEKDLASQRQRMDMAVEGVTNVYIEGWSEEDVGLPPDSDIVFVVPGPYGPEKYTVSCRREAGGLEIYHHHHYHTRMAVFPQASNVVVIRAIKQ